MEKYIAAIDLGTKKVAAAIGERTPHGVKIIAYAQVPSRGMNHGRIENPANASSAIKEAVEKVEAECGLKIEKAYIGIAGHDIQCIITDPVLTPRKVAEELITQEEISNIAKGLCDTELDNGYKVLSAIPQSYNVDNNMSVSQAVGMIGKNIVSRYKLLIGKETFNQLTKTTMKFAGVQMIEGVVEPIAAAKAVLSEAERDAGVVVVDIGGGTTDVIVIQNDIVRHVGIIPFGGNSITNDICYGCKISPKQAEILKINYGCCFADYADANKSVIIKSLSGKDIEIQTKTLAKIIQARMEEILDAVTYHVEQSGFSRNIRAGYVFTGGGSQIKNLINLANNITGKEVRLATPSAVTITADSVDPAKDFTASTAVGLILYGFQKVDEEGLFSVSSVIENLESSVVKPVERQTVAVEKVAEVKPEAKRKRAKVKDGGRGLFSKLNISLFGDNDDNDLNAV